MDPLEFLQAKIRDFPGYTDEGDRRRADELVRSYLGEALAELGARLAPPAALAEQIDALLLRLGFADQRAFSARDGVVADEEPGGVPADDAGLVELAERAGSVAAATLPAYLSDVLAALDRRDAAMIAAAAAR